MKNKKITIIISIVIFKKTKLDYFCQKQKILKNSIKLIENNYFIYL